MILAVIPARARLSEVCVLTGLHVSEAPGGSNIQVSGLAMDGPRPRGTNSHRRPKGFRGHTTATLPPPLVATSPPAAPQATYLHLEEGAHHAAVDADEHDAPLRVVHDEGSGEQPQVDAGGDLGRVGVAHLWGRDGHGEWPVLTAHVTITQKYIETNISAASGDTSLHTVAVWEAGGT